MVFLVVFLATGLVKVVYDKGKIFYTITELGIEKADELTSVYALSYKKSAFLVIKKLKKLSDTRLWENAKDWLEAKSFQVDLWDMVNENEQNKD